MVSEQGAPGAATVRAGELASASARSDPDALERHDRLCSDAHSVQQGVVLGAGLASSAGVLASLVRQVTGTAPAMMGGQGEQWTASELRPLQRRGWRVVHHVSLRPWDIDHVLIGPGGAFAIETKWSAQPWVLEPAEARVLSAARQAADNARDLRLWAPFRKAGIDVQPVVMLWGPAATPDGLGVPTDLDGATVMRGSHAPAWRTRLANNVLSPEQVEAGWLAWKLTSASGTSVSTSRPFCPSNSSPRGRSRRSSPVRPVPCSRPGR